MKKKLWFVVFFFSLITFLIEAWAVSLGGVRRQV